MTENLTEKQKNTDYNQQINEIRKNKIKKNKTKKMK